MSSQHATAVDDGTRSTWKKNYANKMSTLNKKNISDVGNLLTSAFKLFIHSKRSKQELKHDKGYNLKRG
jgi:hypothetical protein